jgi:hypothetical protein
MYANQLCNSEISLEFMVQNKVYLFFPLSFFAPLADNQNFFTLLKEVRPHTHKVTNPEARKIENTRGCNTHLKNLIQQLVSEQTPVNSDDPSFVRETDFPRVPLSHTEIFLSLR